MNKVLEFLVRYCGFLWTGARYRIIGSGVADSFGDAYLDVASDALRMRFTSDRGQLFLDFQEPGANEKAEWYSIDLFCRLIIGGRPESAVLNEEYATFLREHLEEIESRFGDALLTETKARLHDLKRQRTKDMFG